MLANVFYPLACVRNPALWEDFTRLRAAGVNRRVLTACQRLFGTGPEPSASAAWTSHAALQQGLLQVYEDFCLRDNSDCAHCPLPEQLARWREESPQTPLHPPSNPSPQDAD